MGMQTKWLINVPVATLWTTKESARNLDKKAISNPADITGWLAGLTYETSLALCNENRIQSQALYGEEVIVLEEDGEWVKAILQQQSSSKDGRGYPGWLPKLQLARNEDWKVDGGAIAVIKSKQAYLYNAEKSPNLLLSYLTILPVLDQTSDWAQVQTPEGTGWLQQADIEVYASINEQRHGNGKDVVAAGEQFLGLPYLWGGMSSFGYDCSGFAYAACKANGYIIPRDAHDQAAGGQQVQLTEIQPGDLLFFAYEEGKGKIHHVGICYGDGKLLHSPNTGKTIEIIDLQGTIYEKELCAARRYWQEAVKSS